MCVGVSRNKKKYNLQQSLFFINIVNNILFYINQGEAEEKGIFEVWRMSQLEVFLTDCWESKGHTDRFKILSLDWALPALCIQDPLFSCTCSVYLRPVVLMYLLRVLKTRGFVVPAPCIQDQWFCFTCSVYSRPVVLLSSFTLYQQECPSWKQNFNHIRNNRIS